MLVTRLHRLLSTIRDQSGKDFSGVGLLVSAAPEELPIVPLRSTGAVWDQKSTLEVLVTISHRANEFHDGFHILSPELDVRMVSLYFSPPIVTGLDVDPARGVGGRYMAALFGSALPSIMAAGVAS